MLHFKHKSGEKRKNGGCFSLSLPAAALNPRKACGAFFVADCTTDTKKYVNFRHIAYLIFPMRDGIIIIIKNYEAIYALRRKFMNLFKKILVVLLAATLLVSGLTLFSSAEVPKPTVDDLNAVFEYHEFRDNKDNRGLNGFFQDTFSSYDDGYNYVSRVTKALSNFSRCYFYKGTSGTPNTLLVKTDPDNSDNKILVYKNNGNGLTGDLFKYFVGNEAFISNVATTQALDRVTDKLVVTFDVKVDDETYGTYISVALANKLPSGTVEQTYFKLDFSNPEKAVVKYTAYDPEYYHQPAERTLDFAPQNNTWYTVEAIMNFADNELIIDVFERDNSENKATTGKVMFAPEKCNVLDDKGNAGPKYAVLSANSNNGASTAEISFDNIMFYEGTAVRDIVEPGKAINSFLLQVNDAATADTTSIDKRVEIAEFYEKIFYNDNPGMKYVPDATADEAARVQAVNDIKAAAKTYFNKTYAEALIACADTLENDKTLKYYDRSGIYEKATPFYNFFFANGYESLFDYEAGDFDSLDDFPNITEFKAGLEHAKTVYESEFVKRADIKDASVAYVDFISNFNYDSRDYEYIAGSLEFLEGLVDRDNTFKYAEEVGITDENDPKYKYQTVAVAFAEYEAIKSVKDAMDANLKTFTDAIYAMNDEPVKTQGFAAICNNYATASSVYTNGTVHEQLDILTYTATVNGMSISTYIQKYNDRGAYIDARIAECEAFIELIDGASASAAYRGTLTFLDAAALYLDGNTGDKSVETDYPGINEAIATYNALREKLAGDVSRSDAYKAAVNAIDLNAAYASLKAAVEAALPFKETGAVVGIDGVKEANIKLSEAESKIKTLEGNSSTLIATVNKIKDAKTVAERRELIFIATSAAAGAEDAISGVTAAKAALAEAVAQFNSDVEAANSGFFTAVNNAAGVSAGVSDSENAYKLSDIIKAFFKK